MLSTQGREQFIERALKETIHADLANMLYMPGSHVTRHDGEKRPVSKRLINFFRAAAHAAYRGSVGFTVDQVDVALRQFLRRHMKRRYEERRRRGRGRQ